MNGIIRDEIEYDELAKQVSAGLFDQNFTR